MVSARGLVFAAPVLLAVAFVPSLSGAFVWDDALLIEHNPALFDAHGFIAIMTQDLWGQATGASSQLYHPLPMLSIWLQTQLFGMHIEALRLANIALHALVIGLYVRLLERLAVPRTWALSAGLLVLVHPSVCEPVMWITGRHDTLAMVALLCSLLVWPSHAHARPTRAALASGALLALAFLSKEPYVIGPALLGLFAGEELLRTRQRPGWPALAQFGVACLPLMAAVALRRALGISLGSQQLQASVPEHARNYASLVWHYGSQLLAFRNGLTLSRFVPLGTSATLAVWAVLLAVTGLLGSAGLRRRGTYAVALFGWLWFLLALLPHLISTPSIGLYGNRYAYCALFGLATCTVGLCLPLAAAAPAARIPALARVALLLMAAVCALRTGLEAARWHDSRTLFAADVAREPDNGYALYHLGTAVLSGDGCGQALPLFVRATELTPNYERPWHNASGCLIDLGRASAALPFAERSVALAPYNPRARYNLALAQLSRGDHAAAIAQLGIALRLDPSYAAASRALAELSAHTSAADGGRRSDATAALATP